MTTYFNKSEIESSVKTIASDYLKDCLHCDMISEDFVDLLKHNFSAKFVSFNNQNKQIEIGVEDTKIPSHYPVINVLSFPITEEDNLWLDKSFKNQMNDLIFYGNLINRKKYNHKNAEVIVI